MGAKFNFKFEPVERVRKNREQEAIRLLARAQKTLGEAQAHRQRLIDAMNRSLERRELLSDRAIGPADYQIETLFIDGNKVRIKQAEHSIMKAQRGLEKVMRAYLFAKRQLMIIEKLRENALKVFKKERSVREQKQVDDINIMRAGFAHNGEDKSE